MRQNLLHICCVLCCPNDCATLLPLRAPDHRGGRIQRLLDSMVDINHLRLGYLRLGCINHLRLGLRRPRPLQSVAQDAYRVTKETTQKGKQGILKLLLRWRTHPFSRYESQARPASCLTAVGVLSYCYMPVLNACSLSTRVE